MPPMRLAGTVLLLVGALLGCAVTRAQVIPSGFQDGYPSAVPPVGTVLGGLNLVVTTRTATAQPSEPAHVGEPARRSVWTRFTAASSGLYRLRLRPAEGRRIRVAVYTNSTLETLRPLASEALSDSMPEFRWEAQAGETYSLALDSNDDGTFGFESRFDQFYVRGDLPTRRLSPGEVIHVEAVSTGAPIPPGGLRFVVLNGLVREIGPLQPLTIATRDAAPWTASYTNLTGGIVEIAAVDAMLRSSAPLLLSMSTPGDRVAEALELPSGFSDFMATVNVGLAGVEAGEDLPLRQGWFGTPGTIWFRFRPAYTARTRIRSQPQGVWGVYAGLPLGRTPFATGFNEVLFDAEAGQEYYLQMLVAGEPQTRSFGSLRISREALDVLPPPGSRLPGTSDRVFCSTEPVVRLVVTNLSLTDPVVGVRLGERVPSGVDGAGNPFFDVDVSQGFTARPSGTNLAGQRITGRQVTVGHSANDTPGTAIPLPASLETWSLGCATHDPADPVELGPEGTPTAWWRFAVDEAGFVDVPVQSFNPIASAVFARSEGRWVALGRPFDNGIRGWTVPVVPGREYFLGVGGASSVTVGGLDPHGIRFASLPSRLRVGRAQVFRVESVGAFSGNLREVRWNGTVLARGQPLPFEFTVVPERAGTADIALEYEQAGRIGFRTIPVAVPVFPVNDDFADALELASAPDSHDLPLRIPAHPLASRESGEPDPSGRSLPTVWYRWTVEAGGLYRIVATADSPLPQEIHAYAGSDFGSLRPVLRLDAQHPSAELRVAAGEVYSIAVSADREGAFRLDWIQENDQFLSPSPLVSVAPTFLWNPDSAGAEEGEPGHGGLPAQRSLWWIYPASESGVVTLALNWDSPSDSVSDQRVGVYEGDRIDRLSPVSVEVNRYPTSQEIRWEVRRGLVYRVAVDARVRFRIQPPQVRTLTWVDSGQTAVVGIPVRIRLLDLDPELGTPRVGIEAAANSVQGSGFDWVWTPTASGIQGLLVWYTRGTDAPRFFNLAFSVRPANDDFGRATPWTIDDSGSAVASGDFLAASREPEEPAWVGGGRPTLWFTWTCPDSGTYEIGGLQPAWVGYEILEGDSLSTLRAVPVSVQPSGSGRFEAIAGGVYRIVVAPGPLLEPEFYGATFNAHLFRAASNDAFANRRRIGAEERLIVSTLWGASKEPLPEDRPGEDVWFEYETPASGTLTLAATRWGRFGINVFRGDRLEALTRVAPVDGMPTPWISLPVRSGEVFQIQVKAFDTPQPEGIAFRILHPGDPAERGADRIDDSHPLPLGTILRGLLFPFTSPEPFEIQDLPSPSRPGTLWWTHAAVEPGRLLVRLSFPPSTVGSTAALAAVERLPDGTLRPLANLGPGEPLGLDLVTGQRVAIRVAGGFLGTADLESSWTRTPPAPRVYIEGFSTADPVRRLHFLSVPGQPYSVHVAPAPSGPWRHLLRIDSTGSESVIPLAVDAEESVFYRVTTP